MRNNKLLVILCTILVGATSFTITSCGNANNSTSHVDKPTTIVATTTTPSSNTTSIDQPTTSSYVSYFSTEKITKLIDDMGNNYTYSFTRGDKDYSYYFDGNNVQITNNKKQISDYHYMNGDKAYDLIYNQDTDKWGRYDATDYDINTVILEPLKNAEWIDYNETSNYFIGVVDGEKMKLYFEDESVSLVSENEEYHATISQIGKTSVTLPAADKIYNADPTLIE